MDELHHQVSQLAEIMNTFAPVVKELKSAYDAARQQDETDLSDGEIDENVQPRANDSSSGPREPSEALVDDHVQEVTEIASTDKALTEKNSSILDNILASELNEQVLKKRKENQKN